MISSWHTYRQSPIYLREQGHWGNPNPLYSRLNSYSPLVIIGVIVLGACCGGNSLSSAFGVSDLAGGLLVLACLPNLLAQILTWAGIVLAPALTAPTIIEERRRGTWEMLRLTPYPVTHVLTAKMLGGLSRLKIWLPLLIVNGLQLLIGLVALGALLINGSLLAAAITFLTMLLFLIRPWIEIGLAALIGLIFSSFSSSARGALVGSYATVMGIKIVNNSLFWSPLALAGLANPDLEATAFSLVAAGPVIVYVGLTVAALVVLRVRAAALERGELPLAGG